MDMKIRDKVAIVTGGGSGIGQATAKLLSAEGAKVVIVGRSQDRLDHAIREIGGQVLGVAADITDENDVHHIIQKAEDTFGRIDILINNAGRWQTNPLFGDDCLKVFDQQINVNLRGALLMICSVATIMKKNNGGSIVNVSSVSGIRGFAGSSGYAASKAGLISLSQSLALELSECGIRINVLVPGNVETPINAIVREPENDHILRQLKKMTPSGKVFSSPDEIASQIVFMASPLSRPMRGAVIVIDEGVTAGLPALTN